MKSRLLKVFLCATAVIGLLTNAQAATVYGLTNNNHLVKFDSATPGTFTMDVDMSASLPMGWQFIGMDMRTTVQPSSSNAGVGSLWGIATDMTDYRLYVISTSGTITQVGGNLTALSVANVGSDNWGFAFNPATDRFELVGERFNFEINPNNGAAVQKSNVFTSGSMFPAFSGATFSTASYGGTSTFYIADTGADRLAQSSSISSGGLVDWNNSAAQFGASLTGGPNAIDIDKAWALMASEDNLYTLNVSTGVATLVGPMPMGTALRGLAIVPSSFPPKLSIVVKISGKKKITTTKASLLVKGTVKSNSGVSLVEYRVGSKGKFKKVKGSLTKWKFKAKLKPGKNIVSVRAKTGTTTSKIAKVTITRE